MLAPSATFPHYVSKTIFRRWKNAVLGLTVPEQLMLLPPLPDGEGKLDEGNPGLDSKVEDGESFRKERGHFVLRC